METMTIADPLPRAPLRSELAHFFRTWRNMSRGSFPIIAPIRATKGLVGIIRDPHETAHVFTLFEALIGPLEATAMAHFAESARGKALLENPPALIPALSDRAALAALPDGSLGRAYLDFANQEGITADGLIAASDAGRVFDFVPGEDIYRRIGDYLRDSHDLWHVVTGYQGDIIGELALLAFTFAQMGNLGMGVLVGLAATLGPRLPTPIDEDSARAIREAYIRGRRAKWLATVDWVPLLELPLEQVRHELGLDGPPDYPVRRVDPGTPLVQLGR